MTAVPYRSARTPAEERRLTELMAELAARGVLGDAPVQEGPAADVPPPVITGDAVLDRRMALGLTQYALARRAGTSPSAVSRLESGERQPRPGVLAAITAVLWPGAPGTAALAVQRRRRAPRRAVAAAPVLAVPEGQHWRNWRPSGPRRPSREPEKCPSCGLPKPDHLITCGNGGTP